MKRHAKLYEKIYSLENLCKAEGNARRNKRMQYGVQVFDRYKEENILKLHEMLVNKTYRTSPYRTFKVFDPKEREVFSLPYFPDRILHHAVMLQLEPIYNSMFTADTYACIKKRGIHSASDDLKYALRNIQETRYCLKIDVKKFYPSIDHAILKEMHLRKFKDWDLLNLLFEIIDSAPGIPIGNYLSQTFANFYLTPFDHWMKEKHKVKNYFRYMDDIVILSADKKYLHSLLAQIRDYLKNRLKLTIKENYQVFPVSSRGIDFVGYKHFHSHTLIRKGIKKRFVRMMAHNRNHASIQSYLGWFNHANCKQLQKKYLHEKVQ